MRSVDLALGTVQFGLAYGIAGSGAALGDAEARSILEHAWAHGIRRLDTAPSYGDIEQRLAALLKGLNFEIVSKIPAMPSGVEGAAGEHFIVASLERSRERLGDSLRGILFHSADDLAGDDGARRWDAAVRWGEAHGIAIGVSCYDPETLLSLASRCRSLALAQLPSNAFDQRLGDSFSFDDIEITIRSVFLQGLLLMPVEAAGRRVPAAAGAVGRWHDWCQAHDLPPLAAALAFAKGIEGVRYCVVGVDSTAQLDEIATAWETTQPISDGRLASADPEVIDPRRWKVFA